MVNYSKINIKMKLNTPNFYSKLICMYIYNYNQ